MSDKTPRGDHGWAESAEDGWEHPTDDGWGEPHDDGRGPKADNGWDSPASSDEGRPADAPFIAAQQPAAARQPRIPQQPWSPDQAGDSGRAGAREQAQPPDFPRGPSDPTPTGSSQGGPWSAPGHPPTPGFPPAGVPPAGAATAANPPGAYQQPGSPAPQRPRRKGLIALFVVLAVLVAGAAGWGAATFFGNRDADDDRVAATAPPTDDSDPSSGPTSSPRSPSVAPSPTETLPSDPKEALDQLVETDRSVVVGDLDSKWVPQLSSKKVGLEAEGKKWTEEDILAEHQEMRDEYPRVRLVWSGDFSSFKEDDYWVTIAGIGYSDPEDALSWCSSHGLGPDHCYAKQLNTSGGHEGTTRLQD